jgi:ribosomal protein L37AE/L43A
MRPNFFLGERPINPARAAVQYAESHVGAQKHACKVCGGRPVIYIVAGDYFCKGCKNEAWQAAARQMGVREA